MTLMSGKEMFTFTANRGKYTPSTYRAKKVIAETVAVLMTAGAAVNGADNEGCTPLHIACDAATATHGRWT